MSVSKGSIFFSIVWAGLCIFNTYMVITMYDQFGITLLSSCAYFGCVFGNVFCILYTMLWLWPVLRTVATRIREWRNDIAWVYTTYRTLLKCRRQQRRAGILMLVLCFGGLWQCTKPKSGHYECIEHHIYYVVSETDVVPIRNTDETAMECLL